MILAIVVVTLRIRGGVGDEGVVPVKKRSDFSKGKLINDINDTNQ